MVSIRELRCISIDRLAWCAPNRSTSGCCEPLIVGQSDAYPRAIRTWPSDLRDSGNLASQIHPVSVRSPSDLERKFDSCDRPTGNVIGIKDQVFRQMLHVP